MTRVILAYSERPSWIAELQSQLRPSDGEIHRVPPGTEGGPLAADLILLDVSDPARDPVAAYHALPRPCGTPVILLTPTYTDEIAAEALEAGADACLPASISPRETAAWIRALLRRRAAPVPVRNAPFTLGHLTIDLARGRIEKRGAPLDLPPTQLLLLRALAERPGRVVPREQLLARVLGPHPRRKLSTLHVHIFLLRSLIEDDPRNPRYLKTVRGVGYVLTDDNNGPL